MVRVKPTDPQWITSDIHYIRKWKRAYRNAKGTNVPARCNKFKLLQNKVVSVIRNSKSAHAEKIAEKQRSDSLSSKTWWSILKIFISPASKFSLPPIEHTDDKD